MLELETILTTIPQSQLIRIYTHNKKITISGKEILYSGTKENYEMRYLGFPVLSTKASGDTILIELT